MQRGHREYRSFVIGSRMLQYRMSDGMSAKGSRLAVVGSGITSMSLSLIDCHPRMLEPSKPNPSSNVSSLNSAAGMWKCCIRPGKSMNRMSMNCTFSFLTSSITSLGL